MSDEALQALLTLINQYPGFDAPLTDVEQFITDQGLDMHAGASLVTLPAFVRQRAAIVGFDGKRATEDLAELSPDEENRNLILSRSELLSELFDPSPESVAALAASKQRVSPLQTLDGVMVTWEARPLFSPITNPSEITGVVPLFLVRLRLSSDAPGSASTVVFQVDLEDMSKLIQQLDGAERLMGKFVEALKSGVHVVDEPPSEENRLARRDLSWDLEF